jgi:hypothetical protein
MERTIKVSRLLSESIHAEWLFKKFPHLAPLAKKARFKIQRVSK